MKKIIIFILIFFILINSNDISSNIILSFNICFNNLFPSLIPFMLLSNILIKYNIIEELNNIFKFISTKIFKVNKGCGFATIMSMISCTPSNAKYLKDLYDNKLINNLDVEKCLMFCHFNNPIFILNTIGLTFLNNKKMGLIILLSHYLSSFVIGLIFRNKKYTEIKNINIKHNKNSFLNILNESIITTSNTLLLILGIITFCLIITTIINNILNINNNYKFIYGILEITQGLKYLSISNFNIITKSIISSFIISFGGLCIHMQVFSILNNKKIRYTPYFISRLIHGLLSSILTFIFIILFH